jgi:hypothetical protein
MTTHLVARIAGAESGAMQDMPVGQPASVRHCDACGAPVLTPIEAAAVPVRWGDVWFCDGCLRALSAAETQRRTHEVAMRGVPLD